MTRFPNCQCGAAGCTCKPVVLDQVYPPVNITDGERVMIELLTKILAELRKIEGRVHELQPVGDEYF